MLGFLVKLLHIIYQTGIVIIREAQFEKSIFAQHQEAYFITYFAIPIVYKVLYSPIPLQSHVIAMNKYLLIPMNVNSKRFKTWFGPHAYCLVGKVGHEQHRLYQT